jgi:predicted transcriptional regulator
MHDARGHKNVGGELEGAERRDFVRALLNELRALEQLVAEGAFERGIERIGAEQELFLVDRAYNPTPAALRVLERANDAHYTTELGLFNLEVNADPQLYAGRGIHLLEQQLQALYDKLRAAAAELGVHTVLAGILPTIEKGDLGLDNMVPKPRYMALNRAMNAARGEAYDFSIQGIDELMVRHDSVMVEACNASFQMHLQLAEPERFAHYYNVSQLLLGPVLAASTNSPVLFGRRLWNETRIALFEQSCDIRTPGLHLRDAMGRVSFGRSWLVGSVADLYRENISRFRALVGTDLEEDALAVVAAGKVPELKALRLHNGTIYRWNRAAYGFSEGGKPHLRIELRVLPSGPTIADEVSSGAFWLGLMTELGATIDQLPPLLEYEQARANLYSAAREGLGARLAWIDGRDYTAQSLILDKLLPIARAGLARSKVHDADADHYLKILEERVSLRRTGSRWTLLSLAGMKGAGTQGARQTTLVAATIARQASGKVVSEWELARLEENDSASSGAQKVSQYMATELFTVRPDDPIDLVSEVMAWHQIRYMAVEDERGRIVGLITDGAILRHLHKQAHGESTGATSAADLMVTDLVTISPETPTQEAVALMRARGIGCLPVIQSGHLVAMLTAENLVGLELETRPSTEERGG